MRARQRTRVLTAWAESTPPASYPWQSGHRRTRERGHRSTLLESSTSAGVPQVAATARHTASHFETGEGGEGRGGGVRDCRIHCRLAPSPASHNFLSLTLKPDTVRLIVLLSSACVALFVSSSFSRARAFLESLALWANVEGAFRASACLRRDLISSSSTARFVFPGGMTERE